MYSSRFRRAAAVVALATAASVVSVGTTATAAPADRHGYHHHKRINTELAITAPDVADTEGRALVKGRLTARGVPLGQRPVRLLVKREDAARWTWGRVDRTDRGGRVSFRILPPVETSYKLVFLGARHFQAARSAKVTVAARDTKVSIAATPGVIDPGAAAVVSGVVTDEAVPVAGATVELRGRRAGSRHAFEPVGTAVSAADGSVSFTVTPTRSWTYVLKAARTETTQVARSVTATVVVTTPTRIAARGRKIGDTYSVVGLLLARGDGLAGRKVTLETLPAGATEWTAVKTKRTARDGYVDFRQARVEGTSYRLSYAGTTRLQASVSRTVIA